MYNYQTEKQELFTEDGQVLFMGIRDHVQSLLKTSGAFRAQEALTLPVNVGSADSFTQMACLDRMVELGEIVEIPRECWGQYKVYSTPEVHNR